MEDEKDELLKTRHIVVIVGGLFMAFIVIAAMTLRDNNITTATLLKTILGSVVTVFILLVGTIYASMSLVKI